MSSALPTSTELLHLRRRLEERRDELAARRDRTTRRLAEANEPIRHDTAERGAAENRIRAQAEVAEVETEELQRVDDALRRMDRGEYGRCERCDAAIEPERLQAMPEAVTCLRCAERES